MNLPNKLTIIRMVLVIPFIIMAAWAISLKGNYAYHDLNLKTTLFITAGILFLIAMGTDYFDGHLARKHHLVSAFGKLFDPLADKFMITSALIILSLDKIVPFYLTLIIILRDIMVDGSRNLAAAHQLKIDASIWGKLKTMLMALAITMTFFIYPVKDFSSPADTWLLNIPLMLSVLLSVFSGYKYFYDIIPLIKNK